MTQNTKKAVTKLYEDIGNLFYKWKSENNIETSLIISLAIYYNTFSEAFSAKNLEALPFPQEPKDKFNGIDMSMGVYKNYSNKTFKMHAHNMIENLIASYGDPNDYSHDNDNDDNNDNDNDD